MTETIFDGDMSKHEAVIRDYIDSIYSHNRAAGWYSNLDGTPKQRNVGELLMLIVSEVAEGMEGFRKGLQDDKLPHRSMIEVELADTFIRICDLCGYLDLDLAKAVTEKFRYNQTREDHKLENRAKDGGKKF